MRRRAPGCRTCPLRISEIWQLTRATITFLAVSTLLRPGSETRLRASSLALLAAVAFSFSVILNKRLAYGGSTNEDPLFSIRGTTCSYASRGRCIRALCGAAAGSSIGLAESGCDGDVISQTR